MPQAGCNLEIFLENPLSRNNIIIKITGLSKTYPGGHIANKDINLNIAEGEFFTLLGPNGAGKSTLIKQITSEIKPSSGNVLIQNIDVHRYPTVTKSKMGIMPQECGMFEHLTIRQHLNIFSKLKGAHFNAGTSKELIDILNLNKNMKKNIGSLSLGVKRQILLVTALVGEPPILILDEPTAGLAPEARSAVLGILGKLKKKGITIFLTTHLMDEAEMLSDRIAILVDGELRHCGDLALLRSKLNNRYEIKMKLDSGDYVSEQFSDLCDAIKRFSNNGSNDFSLSTVSLENIYLDLVRNVSN